MKWIALAFAVVLVPSLLHAEDPAADEDPLEFRVLCPRDKVAALQRVVATLGASMFRTDGATDPIRHEPRPEVVPTAAWDTLRAQLLPLHPKVVEVTRIRVYQSVVVIGLRGRDRERLRGDCWLIQQRLAGADLLAVSPKYRLEGFITEDRRGFEVDLVLVFKPAVAVAPPTDGLPADETVASAVTDSGIASGVSRMNTAEREVEALQPRRVTWHVRAAPSDLRSTLAFLQNLSAMDARMGLVLLAAEWEADDLSPLPEESPRGATWIRIGAVPE